MEDIVLSDPGDNIDDQRTRKIFRSMLVANRHDPMASVNGALLYQRRGSKNEWEDTQSINLSTLKAGEGVRFPLKAGELRSLYLELRRLYALPIGDKPISCETDLLMVPADEFIELTDDLKALILRLDSEGQRELINLLAESDNDLTETTLLRQQHRSRMEAVEEFEFQIFCDEWSESEWQTFFEANTWIFGHNLAYQFVTTLENQAQIGAPSFRRTGGSRVDMLLRTEGNARFTVLVDIKCPGTKLIDPKPYRNNAYRVNQDVAGGVAQLQYYCQVWSHDSHIQSTKDELDDLGVDTCQPKGILVVGNLSQLDSRKKKTSFELFRRQLWSPEIITYDELLERAKFTVKLESEHIE